MRIKKILNRNRRDFTALYECEHCGHEHESYGYDDAYFHQTVIPEMECKECGKTAGEDYLPLATRHPDSELV